MTKLSDLTLSQIAVAYGVIAGIPTGPKTFNSRAKGITRLEALLAERGLSVADALAAAGLAVEAAAEGDDRDAPGAADTEDTPAPSEQPVAAITPPNAGAPLLADTASRAAALEGVRDALIAAGHDEAAVLAAADWLDGVLERALARPTKTARAPRADSKQEQVLNLLRRPEGATITEIAAATAWRQHTIRGFFAGALKRKLGIAVASEKVEGRGRIYRVA